MFLNGSHNVLQHVETHTHTHTNREGEREEEEGGGTEEERTGIFISFISVWGSYA